MDRRQRYLDLSQFKKRCSDLGVQVDDNQLERYEKYQVLMPAMRIVKPDEYIQLARANPAAMQPAREDMQPDWHTLETLLFGKLRLEEGDNRLLWHPIDAEIDLGNPYASQPAQDTFRPWQEYRTPVKSASGQEYLTHTAKHYYHYWQVHQVYKIHKQYSLFANHYQTMQRAYKDSEYPSSILPSNDIEAALEGQYNYYDALSFYIVLHDNEQDKTFKPIAEDRGFKRLTKAPAQAYQNRQIAHAKFVYARYNLTEEGLYQFLKYLLDLRNEYRKDEKARLAQDVKQDIFYLVRFMMYVTGSDFDTIQQQVETQYGIFLRQDLRHLNKILEIQDCVQDTFKRLRPTYNAQFPNDQLSEADLDALLSFLNKQAILFVLSHAIFEIDKIPNESRNFRNTDLYIALSNLSTGFESMLRELINGAKTSHRVKTDTKTLGSMILSMWDRRLNRKLNALHNTLNADPPIVYIQKVYPQPKVPEIARCLLVSFQARNLVAHSYIEETTFYTELYSIIYNSIVDSIFYTWVYATRKGWV